MITYHSELIQGSDEWIQERLGLLTASEMKLIITPKLKVADNINSRAHFYELLAQRISKHVEPSFVSDDMLRGADEEILARDLYAEKYAPVEQVGFVTNDSFGFTLGGSPDGLVGADGLIEAKSRRQKFQIETILTGTMPDDYLIQAQTLLLVTGRKWLDFLSYSNGLPMIAIRVEPDPVVQAAILAAATKFEADMTVALDDYERALKSSRRLQKTERRVIQEMYV